MILNDDKALNDITVKVRKYSSTASLTPHYTGRMSASGNTDRETITLVACCPSVVHTCVQLYGCTHVHALIWYLFSHLHPITPALQPEVSKPSLKL